MLDTIQDVPPESDKPTEYDWLQRIVYLRLLDADAAGADWRDVAKIVLGVDATDDPKKVHQIWSAHLARAKWMAAAGYRDYLSETAAVRPIVVT